MNEAWEILIKHYADGRTVCNCGLAYYSLDGKAVKVSGEEINNHPYCKYGCMANKWYAKDEIAKKVLTDFINLGVI